MGAVRFDEEFDVVVLGVGAAAGAPAPGWPPAAPGGRGGGPYHPPTYACKRHRPGPVSVRGA